MAQKADFENAHWRHWIDAELLYVHERWGNADHLFGFSAECGLKAIMVRLGMDVTPLGAPKEKDHKVHIHKLWPEFQQFAAGRAAPVYVRAMPEENPFEDWSHHDRYSNTGFTDIDAVDKHRNAARTIVEMVDLVKQDSPI